MHDLKPGEKRVGQMDDMVVDGYRRCFLDPDTKLHKDAGLSIRVTRVEKGFLIPTLTAKVESLHAH